MKKPPTDPMVVGGFVKIDAYCSVTRWVMMPLAFETRTV